MQEAALPAYVHDPYKGFQHVFACITIGFVQQLGQPHNGATSEYYATYDALFLRLFCFCFLGGVEPNALRPLLAYCTSP
jgi:hypothetical protein